jgi:hypothetical protein
MNWNMLFGKKIKFFGFFLFVIFAFYNLFIKDNFISAKNSQSLVKPFFGDILIAPKEAKESAIVIFGFSCPHCREFLKSELQNIVDKIEKKKNKNVIIRMLPDSSISIKLFSYLNAGSMTDKQKLNTLIVMLNNFGELFSYNNVDMAIIGILEKNKLLKDQQEAYRFLNDGQTQKKGIENVKETIASGISSVPTILINGNLSKTSDLKNFID